ncbi:MULTISPECIES: non-heme iron oxygenase ferredoxin subunit [Burkholderia]|uniref:non-heme iron oxygenase ferredoxin subunit n=1 Tax=Burkholderia TaxID=32008 RepID=UPI000CDA3274|nr:MULTISPECIES: non-heme iron oxygenase ferredoxin subunit [Burkholderia]NIE83799.1 non-heme iron oxygenase ferredoxin subunit [Burkholderia sp. Tr-860]NIF61426.1 non-heme iron oxygenase ferredoxin subunit [Burkholderia sp. Cy-647]NIF68819.1 non-heme iron oxygenase ferredoxin subunit [Burkholderia sp. Ap-962]NIF87238.1 non-heme iron oxygenase ferredoxin subunit [Burkholderia sp. Cy-637]NIF94436.1 non-heme iron oxygenase ferredoxin subunit [Burkholderia sp. Ax-1720]
MSQACSRVGICKVSEVGEGKAIRIEKHGLTLAVFNVDGQFFVTDDTCTHGPGSLSEGCLEGHRIECDFHNGAFDIRTGAVVSAPCMIPLKTYEAHVENGEIGIDVADEH